MESTLPCNLPSKAPTRSPSLPIPLLTTSVPPRPAVLTASPAAAALSARLRPAAWVSSLIVRPTAEIPEPTPSAARPTARPAQTVAYQVAGKVAEQTSAFTGTRDAMPEVVPVRAESGGAVQETRTFETLLLPALRLRRGDQRRHDDNGSSCTASSTTRASRPTRGGGIFLGGSTLYSVLNIKDPEVDRLARELAAATGETITRAVMVAVRERLERIAARRSGRALADELDEIALRCGALPVLDDRPEAEVLGYDDAGLPTQHYRTW